MPILSVRLDGPVRVCYGPVYQVRSACVCGIIRSIRPSGEHTPGEAIAGVVARPADGSSA